MVCEISFALSWVLEHFPKFCLVNKIINLNVLKEIFECPSPQNPRGRSNIPEIDVFVSIVDLDKEPPLVTAKIILSILVAKYLVRSSLPTYLIDRGDPQSAKKRKCSNDL